LTRRARYQYALAISAVLLLSIGLRLIFILDVSRIPVVWDAEIYWSLAVGIRNLICTSLKYCSPDIYAHTETMQVALRSIFVDRYGLLPASMAAALTVLPTDPKSVYFVFAILDCLVCMMAMNIASRLGLPLWAATLAGLSSAIYVPAVVSTASFLQQPFIRFWLVFATWNYARALTAGPDRRIGGSILLGTFASFVVGFSSTTTRPLMWVLPIAVVFIGSFTADRQFRNLQLKCLVALLALLGIVLASVRAVIPDISTINLISDLAIGIPIDRAGSDQLQVTVLSFRDFWPPTAWYPDSVPFATRSLFQDMVRAPFSFAYWLNYSIYCNWLFPDHLYFQQYLLNISEQNIQHWIVVVLGLAGIACLLGQPGPRRNIGILIAVLVLFISLSNGMISVEPRRLTTLAPFLSVGLAYCDCLPRLVPQTFLDWRIACRRQRRHLEVTGSDIIRVVHAGRIRACRSRRRARVSRLDPYRPFGKYVEARHDGVSSHIAHRLHDRLPVCRWHRKSGGRRAARMVCPDSGPDQSSRRSVETAGIFVALAAGRR
jgi:hypothetical protein